PYCGCCSHGGCCCGSLLPPYGVLIVFLRLLRSRARNSPRRCALHCRGRSNHRFQLSTRVHAHRGVVDWTVHAAPAATTPRRSAFTASAAVAPTGSALPSTSLIWSSRSMTCLDQRTKSPAESSWPFASAAVSTFSSDSPRAQRYTGQANP